MTISITPFLYNNVFSFSLSCCLPRRKSTWLGSSQDEAQFCCAFFTRMKRFHVLVNQWVVSVLYCNLLYLPSLPVVSSWHTWSHPLFLAEAAALQITEFSLTDPPYCQPHSFMPVSSMLTVFGLALCPHPTPLFSRRIHRSTGLHFAFCWSSLLLFRY